MSIGASGPPLGGWTGPDSNAAQGLENREGPSDGIPSGIPTHPCWPCFWDSHQRIDLSINGRIVRKSYTGTSSRKDTVTDAHTEFAEVVAVLLFAAGFVGHYLCVAHSRSHIYVYRGTHG